MNIFSRREFCSVSATTANSVNMICSIISAFLWICLATGCSCYSIDFSNDTELAHMFFQNKNSRIVGNEKVSVGDFPHQVSIQYREEHICGGVLLSQNHILTAASCLLSTHKMMLNPKLLRVMAGGVETGEYSTYAEDHPLFADRRQFVNVDRVYIHSDFNTATKKNNIALIKTATKIELLATADYTFAALATSQTTSVPDGLRCRMSGWGVSDSSESEFSEVLKAATVFIANHDACSKIYPDITEAMICAGTTRVNGNPFCDGDIGGGLICNNELVGIASHSSTCGPAPYLVGVYTEIRPYLEWIKETKARTDAGSLFDDRFNAAAVPTRCLFLLAIAPLLSLLLLL